MRCQCGLINCKFTILAGNEDGRERHMCGVSVWAMSLPSPRFCRESKSVQKNKMYLKDHDDDDDDDGGDGGEDGDGDGNIGYILY